MSEQRERERDKEFTYKLLVTITRQKGVILRRKPWVSLLAACRFLRTSASFDHHLLFAVVHFLRPSVCLAIRFLRLSASFLWPSYRSHMEPADLQWFMFASTTIPVGYK
jgi:hypothetical protein